MISIKENTKLTFTVIKYYSILCILFIFSACDVSTLSDEDTKNISKFKVHIFIEDGNKENLLDEIKVRLSDGKKQIINEKIKILLNGEPLELFVKQELYYTKTSFYRDTNLARRNSYYFEIILPDSTKHPLAFLKPLKRSDSAKFYIPKTNYNNEDLTLEWKNINTPTTLEILKSVHLKNNSKKHSAGRIAEARIKETINTKSGKHTISKSFFKDSLTVTNYLKVIFNRLENGLINQNLLKNSSITYNYTIEETINIKEEE
ncbi:MAG: hypothetical protein L3J14_04850 [Flavobacteriaceae bacterium]|nr:hypothetical protein [Flavobacteriaceae bacterium]